LGGERQGEDECAFGRSLTGVAALPPGSPRDLAGPYAKRKSCWLSHGPKPASAQTARPRPRLKLQLKHKAICSN